MSLFKQMTSVVFFVHKSLRQHLLSSTVTIFSAALASGLLMGVFVITEQSYQAFTGGPIKFDAVLGARGSKLQLVLNTVFHLETSPGNIPWKLYQEIKQDSRVELAVPYAVGDNYQGFRIVGTSQKLFTELTHQGEKFFQVQRGGRLFDPHRREAVIGSYVAEKTGLKVGSYFQPYHGVVYDQAMQHSERYVVTGILQATNTPSDKVLWIPIEGIFRMSDHLLRGSGEAYQAKAGQEIPDKHKEVSAVMLKLNNPAAGFFLSQTINQQGTVATLAWPIADVLVGFFGKIGWITEILRLISYLVAMVVAGAILASIYNTMNERQREFAIFRALGAKRHTLLATIVCESGMISLLGSLLGYLVYAGIFVTACWIIRQQTGVVLEWQWHFSLWAVPLGMLLLGVIAGLVPAWKAYHTDVAKNLVPRT